MTLARGAPLVVVGDALLDVDLIGEVTRHCPDAPDAPVLDLVSRRSRPGGAGLAALLAASDGAPVRLVTALADDADAELLRTLLAGARVEVVAGGATGTTPVKCRLRSGGRSIARVDRGGAHPLPAPREVLDAVRDASAVLVSDYGRGLAADPAVRAALAATGAPVLWDPHPRGPDPVRGVALATPNLDEALLAGGGSRTSPDGGHGPVPMAALAARRVRVRWGAQAVAVTLGAHGALLDRPGADGPLVPAPLVAGGDPCGAGDRFASAAALAVRAGADLPEAVAAAVVSAAAFVGAGGAAAVGTAGDLSSDDAWERMWA